MKTCTTSHTWGLGSIMLWPWGLSFSKAIFEGLILGGAYIWRGLCMEGNLRFKINN